MRTAIYTRISQDDGTAHGVARQLEDCRREASRRGWDVVDVFEDNDVSASRSKVRPQFQRMLDGIDAGHVDSVVVWDVDRLTRSPRELEDFIDLADRHGLALASVGGDIDLGTPQGRMTARIKGTVARHEVEQMSKRIRRAGDQRAAAGMPAAQVGYGFRRIDGAVVEEPSEASTIREAVRRILDGATLRSICIDFDGRGIPTPGRGARWNTTTLRQLVLRESLAGLRRHRGVVVGELHPDIPRILTRDEHDRLVAVLNDPHRRTSPVGRAPKYLLGGIARCGLCGGVMIRAVGRVTTTKTGGTKRQPASYACSECYRVRRKQDDVDQLVEEIVIRRLEQPDLADTFDKGDAKAEKDAREALAALEARLAIAADQFADGVLTGDQLRRITEKLRAESDKQERALAAALPAPLPARLRGPDVRAAWADASVDEKRITVATLMTVTILPGGAGKPFDPSLVKVEWL